MFLRAIYLLLFFLIISGSPTQAQITYKPIEGNKARGEAKFVQQFFSQFIKNPELKYLEHHIDQSFPAGQYKSNCGSDKEWLRLGELKIKRKIVETYPTEFNQFYRSFIEYLLSTLVFFPETVEEVQFKNSLNIPLEIKNIDHLRTLMVDLADIKKSINSYLEKHSEVITEAIERIQVVEQYLNDQLNKPSDFFYLQGGDKCYDAPANTTSIFIGNFIFVLTKESGEYKIKSLYIKDLS